MNPKPTTDIDAAGIEAQRLFAEDRTADAGLKDLRSQKIARKEQLKKALTVVWEALEAGHSVNGSSSKEVWCKSIARCTTRAVQHIIYGRKKNDANKRSHVVTLKDDATIKIGSKLFRILSAPTLDDLQKTKSGHYRVGMLVEPLEEEKPAPKKKVKRYSQRVDPSFILMPAKPHKTHKMSNDGRRRQQAQAGRPVEDRACAGVQTEMNHANLAELKDWYQEEKPKRL